MSNHTVNDLLKILGKDSSESEPISTSKIDGFIKQFNLEKGLDRIPTYIIFYTYKEVFKGELSKVEFFRQFSKLFEKKRTGKQRVYLLSSSSFDMTREGIIRADFHNRKEKK